MSKGSKFAEEIKEEQEERKREEEVAVVVVVVVVVDVDVDVDVVLLQKRGFYQEQFSFSPPSTARYAVAL